MNTRIPQPRPELPAQIRTHEAQLLAVMLRTSRLTWVFAEPDADKSGLLKTGVLPLLQRRQADRQAAPPAELPRLPDRRRRSSASARAQREAALYFDSWQHAPLAELKQRIADLLPDEVVSSTAVRLAPGLQELARSGVDLVLLLDRFEEFLVLSPGEDEVRHFADELLEAIALPGLSARFLISMDEAARPRLERFRARIPGFDHNVLRLSPVAPPGSLALPALPAAPEFSPPRVDVEGIAQASTRPTARPRRRPPSPRATIKVEDVYSLIESTLERTAARTPAAEDPPFEAPGPEGPQPPAANPKRSSSRTPSPRRGGLEAAAAWLRSHQRGKR